MVLPIGFEPTPHRLKVECATVDTTEGELPISTVFPFQINNGFANLLEEHLTFTSFHCISPFSIVRDNPHFGHFQQSVNCTSSAFSVRLTGAIVLSLSLKGIAFPIVISTLHLGHIIKVFTDMYQKMFDVRFCIYL